MGSYSRRGFLKSGLGLGVTTLAGQVRRATGALKPQTTARTVAIASANGLRAVEKAMEIIKAEGDPLEAVIAGVNIIEDDPNDMSVGYGGLPNEDGIVELDASVMYGPTHRAGAVAALRNIKNPSKVARLVMERTDHVLLAGQGALRFAKAHGFKEENLLTEKAREMWLKWKETMSERDNWLAPEKKELPSDLQAFIKNYGTITCLAVDGLGRLAGVTTTSGLSFKLAGRIGDSPIIGAGLYVDDDIGAAGSTGRGEANLQTCASFKVVDLMGRGRSPEQACLETLEYVAAKTRLVPRLCDENGRPNFGLNFYAVNKKGECGSASFYARSTYAVHDGRTCKLAEGAYLYRKN